MSEQHRDESGEPCTRHPEPVETRLLELATLGSRMPSFHHDAASKLQSLMMALDEINELSSDADPIVRAALDTAGSALRDLHQMLTANRALAKPPQRTRAMLGEVLQRASERVGVNIRGELPPCEVRVAVPALTHALAMLVDVAAGPTHLGRIVDATLVTSGGATLTIVGPREAAAKPAANIGEALALASFVIARDEGKLTCGGEGERFVVQMPLAIDTAQLQKVP